MCGRTVTSGEGLSRDNKGRCVWAEVLEEVGKAVKENESVSASGRGIQLVISETFGKNNKR